MEVGDYSQPKIKQYNESKKRGLGIKNKNGVS